MATGEMSSKLLEELEELRAWRKEMADRGATPATSDAAGSCDTSALKAKEAELEALRTQLQETEKNYNRVVLEKSRINEMVTTDKAVEMSAMTSENAQKILDKCAKSSGKIIADPSVEVWKGYACKATEEEMARYLDYEPRGMCPDDWFFVQDLIYQKNCFALPKRRCRNQSPYKVVQPVPFPNSLFNQSSLSDDSVRWEQIACDSFHCLNTRLRGDCRNCFNLTQEAKRWKFNYRGSLQIKEVIEMFGGGLRIGLDAGGGTGSFAAHMALWNVTIMTTAYNQETIYELMNQGLPYMETIALRGLIPLHVPHKARLPFYDNTLDIIHAVNSIKYLPMPEFEELLFEWNRVLRPGGVIWFEMFYAQTETMALYVSIIELLNFEKKYWKLLPKPDSSEQPGSHLYLNCLITKPPQDPLTAPPVRTKGIDAKTSTTSRKKAKEASTTRRL
eukprot:TRINITY_DN1266_c0_g1_i1.p1 TRINITY_DN1266_c0_g1~~TRINITY_DN1266_c0_g1_i1.p1  ORF type:complete len:447 (-),score=82.33 TRINITY_DN1266_c0_g1_i1:90-1430(-)